jgi:hypothetical protein
MSTNYPVKNAVVIQNDGAETVSETSDYSAILTCLIAREDLIAFLQSMSLHPS